MCGIAGILDWSACGADRDVLQRMCDAIVHRGPDDQGLRVDGPVGIGMRRLSIIDLAGGHQPLSNEDGSVWVVFNGEIYNYQALRAGLEQRGHRFATHSDTETLVHLYEEHGDELVQHLNGMFCFALWDARRQRLLIARDRAGEKQLYYAQRDGRLVFGSEIKCLLAAGAAGGEIDLQALDGFLAYAYAPAPRTIFRDVRELPAAHLLVADRQGVQVRRYWDLAYAIDRRRSLPDTVAEFAARFDAAVRMRLVSDVPLGALLSGGVDSSAVVAAMSRHASGPVRTFCIGYGAEGAYYDERRYARAVAERFGTRHEEFVVEPDILDILPRLVQAFDQPFADSSAIANYYVFQETRKHVTVVLSGLGGDEIAAGYERHQAIRLQRLYRLLPRPLREGLIERVVAALPDARKGSRLVERAKRFVRDGALPAERAYLQFSSTFDTARRTALYSPALARAVDPGETEAHVLARFERGGIGDPLDRALYTDLMTYLPGDLLPLTDRMSMVHSIEARAPFVDHTLVEFMATVPPEWKIRGLDKKHLLKLAMAGVLPREIMYRRKQGFTVPLTVWLRRELAPLVQRTLSRERIEAMGLFRWPAVERLLDEHARGRENHHSRIWALLMFHLWQERYAPEWKLGS